MSAIEAVFANTKRLAGRGVVQIILEVPEQMHPAVHERLGYPVSGESIWVAVARLVPPEQRELADIPEHIAELS